MVRPVPELCIWWAISQSCLRLLRLLDRGQGLQTCSGVSRFHILIVTPSRYHISFHLTDWLTASHRASGSREAKTSSRTLLIESVFQHFSILLRSRKVSGQKGI